MKKQLNRLLSELRTEQMELLTTLVKETIAPDYDLPKYKSFTTADLWNIQRQVRRRTHRRFSF